MSNQRSISICNKIIEWCFYCLLLAVTFSTSIVEIASTLMIIAWIAKKILDKDLKILNSAIVSILIIYLIWVALSFINTEYYKESFRGIFKVLQYVLIFIIAATSLGDEKIVKRSIFAIMAGALVAGINGIFQYFVGFDFVRHRYLTKKDTLRRISASFVHPNDFGVYLLIVSIIFIVFLISSRSLLRNKLIAFFLLALSMINLFLTQSRGAWISFASAFLVVGTLKSRRMIGVFLAILLVLFILLPYSAQERVFNLADLKEGTTWERLMLWKGAINMIKEHPFLGFGVNTYSRVFPRYRPPEYPDVRYSHNCYLHMASEIGIVGALLFLIFLVTVLVRCLKGIISMKRSIRKDYAIGLFAGVVGFALNSIVDTHLYSVNLAVLFHLLLGFCFAVSCHEKK